MKLTIQVNHIISFDPRTIAVLEAIFPNQAALDALAKDIQGKTATLQTAVDDNTPPA
jgi:hypothetical protein